jgi:hypothetical protein
MGRLTRRPASRREWRGLLSLRSRADRRLSRPVAALRVSLWRLPGGDYVRRTTPLGAWSASRSRHALYGITLEIAGTGVTEMNPSNRAMVSRTRILGRSRSSSGSHRARPASCAPRIVLQSVSYRRSGAAGLGLPRRRCRARSGARPPGPPSVRSLAPQGCRGYRGCSLARHRPAPRSVEIVAAKGKTAATNVCSSPSRTGTDERVLTRGGMRCANLEALHRKKAVVRGQMMPMEVARLTAAVREETPSFM